MASSKVAVSLNAMWGKILSILGYSVEIFLLTGEITYISTGEIVAAIVILLLMVASSLLIVAGAKIKHRIKRFNNYLALISINNTTSLDLIALKTSQSIDFVRKDIQKMIDKRFFAEAYIDNNTNEIIISREPTAVKSAANQPAKTETAVISCGNCGATNTVFIGRANECQYCGSPLE